MNTQLPPEDEALLRHYREHHDVQPSTAMDAQVLAAARQAVASTRMSWAARLRRQLAGLSLTQRGSLAFGSLAAAALTLGLVLQGLPENPQQRFDDRVELPAAASAPVMESMAPAPMASQRSAAPATQTDMPRRREMSKALPGAASREPGPAFARKPAASQLDAGLREVLLLREQHRHAEASERLQQLREHYPNEPLQQRLEQLAEDARALR